MNHVTNYFSKHKGKVFKKCFIVSMTASIVISFCYYGSTADNDLEKEIGQHDEETQLKPPVINTVPEVSLPHQEETEEPILPEPIIDTEEITETIEETEEKVNALYYVNENGWKSYLKEEYQNHLYKMCIKYDVEEYYTLFIAQMYHESTFRSNLISGTNDYGLMQINTCNHEWLGELLGNDNFLDPYNNIEAGIYMMSKYLHKYNDVEKALVCYNRGESAVINGTYSTSYSKGVLYDMNLLVELD